MAAYQQDIYGAEHELSAQQIPDPALAKRLARRDVNRGMKSAGVNRSGAIRGEPQPEGEPSVRMDGLPSAMTRAIAPPHPFHPFDNVAWQRLGRYEEVPTDTLHTAQRSVDRRRVAELAENPSLGKHPRLPHEKPYVLRTRAKVTGSSGFTEDRPKVDVVINGNHRAVSEIQRGAMFVAAQVIDDTPEARTHAQMISHQRGMLDQSAEGARALREGTVTGIAADRTKEFVESQRAAYRDVGR